LAKIIPTVWKERLKEWMITKQETMATWAGIAAKKAEEAQNKKGLVAHLWNAAAKTLGKFAELPAPWGFIAGLAAAGAILALIGVGIAAVGGAFSGTKSKEEEQAEENKNVASTVEEIGKAYDNAKQSVEDFKTAVSEYDEGIDALSELKKGTEEYSEKLDEVNAKAKELIETYGLWDDYKVNAETGVYEIDEEALDRVEKEKEDSFARVE
jgi:methyl-accepting chemotaxis protein